MNDRTISIVKIQEHNNGFYCRIPASVAKLTRIRKGDYIRVSVSVDRRVIKLSIDNKDDIIILDEPEPQHNIPVEPEPAARHRLSLLMQRMFGGK